MTKKTTYTPVYLMSDEETDVEQQKLSKDFVSISSNQVFFYDDVSRQTIYSLNRQLDSTAKAIQLLNLYNLFRLY